MKPVGYYSLVEITISIILLLVEASADETSTPPSNETSQSDTKSTDADTQLTTDFTNKNIVIKMIPESRKNPDWLKYTQLIKTRGSSSSISLSRSDFIFADVDPKDFIILLKRKYPGTKLNVDYEKLHELFERLERRESDYHKKKEIEALSKLVFKILNDNKKWTTKDSDSSSSDDNNDKNFVKILKTLCKTDTKCELCQKLKANKLSEADTVNCFNTKWANCEDLMKKLLKIILDGKNSDKNTSEFIVKEGSKYDDGYLIYITDSGYSKQPTIDFIKIRDD